MTTAPMCGLAALLLVMAFTSFHLAVEDRAAGKRLSSLRDLFAAWGCLALALMLLLGACR